MGKCWELIKFAGRQSEVRQHDAAESRWLIADSYDLSVILPRGFHPFPSRTRKLSPAGPIVLHAKVCGRVGRCRHINKSQVERSAWLFPFSSDAHRFWWRPDFQNVLPDPSFHILYPRSSSGARIVGLAHPDNASVVPPGLTGSFGGLPRAYALG